MATTTTKHKRRADILDKLFCQDEREIKEAVESTSTEELEGLASWICARLSDPSGSHWQMDIRGSLLIWAKMGDRLELTVCEVREFVDDNLWLIGEEVYERMDLPEDHPKFKDIDDPLATSKPRPRLNK